MDSKRLILATLLSALVLIGFDYFFPQAPAHQPAPQVTQTVASQAAPASAAVAGAGQAATAQAATAAVADVPDGPDTRIAINAPSVQGSINLRGARLDDLVLKQYRETVKPNSPDVRVLSPVDTKRLIMWISAGARHRPMYRSPCRTPTHCGKPPARCLMANTR